MAHLVFLIIGRLGGSSSNATFGCATALSSYDPGATAMSDHQPGGVSLSDYDAGATDLSEQCQCP